MSRSPRRARGVGTPIGGLRFAPVAGTEAAMHHFKSSSELSSLIVLIVATLLFAAGLAYEGTALKPPRPTAQFALPDPNP